MNKNRTGLLGLLVSLTVILYVCTKPTIDYLVVHDLIEDSTAEDICWYLRL